MKNKKFTIIILILISIGVSIIKESSLKNIDKKNLNVMKYIEYADKVSENKKQVNWKNIACILAVLNNNNFKKVKENQIEEVSNLFIDKENKLNSIDEVLDNLDLNNKQVERVYKYLDDLKNYGIKPSRLREGSKYMTFINSIKEGAINNYKEYGVLPSITIAQSILESSWGESVLAKDFNNLFGIKADTYWTGESVTLETSEYNNVTINDKFRKYKDKNESIKDHAKFLAENKRYKNNGVFNANTYINQAKALEKAGYSTIMNDTGKLIYADMLITLIQQYNLQLIDSEVQESL